MSECLIAGAFVPQRVVTTSYRDETRRELTNTRKVTLRSSEEVNKMKA